MLKVVLAALSVAGTQGWTSIKVINEWTGGIQHTDLNVKITGEGVGGCDIVMHPANASGPQVDEGDCRCLWGTVGYRFQVWLPAVDEDDDKLTEFGNNDHKNTSNERGLLRKRGNVTALPFCSDSKGLDNCYHKSYTCTIGADKLCHCEH